VFAARRYLSAAVEQSITRNRAASHAPESHARTISAAVNHEDNAERCGGEGGRGGATSRSPRDSIDISALTSFVIWRRTMLAH